LLITILAVLAGLQSAAATTPAAVNPAPAQTAAIAAKPPKPKHKHHEDCGDGSMSIGSHVVMDSCPSEQDQEDALRRALIDVRQSSSGVPGPH
jgi:hypothetical protein